MIERVSLGIVSLKQPGECVGLLKKHKQSKLGAKPKTEFNRISHRQEVESRLYVGLVH